MNNRFFDGAKSSDTTRFYKQSFTGFYLFVIGMIASGVWLVHFFMTH